MAKARSYKLLCPIARALDRIGDRWTLLILRDLHAGPARFTELQRGLTGIAANLLTDRLNKLVEDQLVEKVDGGHGTVVYELTSLGARTGDIIFELAVFGGQFKPEGETQKPGNLRTVATTLGAAAKRVATPNMNFRACLIVDSESISLSVQASQVEMIYAPCPNPDIILTCSYIDLLGLSEGEIDIDEFTQNRSQFQVLTSGTEVEFFQLMGMILALLQQ